MDLRLLAEKHDRSIAEVLAAYRGARNDFDRERAGKLVQIGSRHEIEALDRRALESVQVPAGIELHERAAFSTNIFDAMAEHLAFLTEARLRDRHRN